MKKRQSTKGPGHPTIKHLMSQLSPLVSRSILIRSAPNLGCYFPGISFLNTRPVVPGLAPRSPLSPIYSAISARVPSISKSATGRPLPRQEHVSASPTPRDLSPGTLGDATAPRSRPCSVVLGPVVHLPRPHHRAHKTIFTQQSPFSGVSLGIIRSARGIITTRT